MGKILFSTCGKNEFIIRRSQKQGFKLNQIISTSLYTSCSFLKKIRKIENAYLHGNDFCFSAGTLIYQDKIGIEALSSIFSDFNGDVDIIRKDIIGNYCLIICKKSKITIFVDKYDIYKVFYQIRDRELFISSDISDVMYHFCNTNIHEYNLMLEAFHCAPMGEDTFINGIKRIQGRQVIEYDLVSKEFRIKTLSYNRKHYEYDSVDDAAKYMSASISKAYRSVKNAFGNDVGINMTGGLDSRVVLGGCLAAGIRPQLLHAQGNSRLVTGTEIGDYKCVHNMANLLSLRVQDMNWNCNYPENLSEWDSLFEKYSFNNKFYGGNPNFFYSYEKLGDNMPLFLETGLFGEIMRIREKYNTRTTPFASIHEFIDEYQYGGNNSGYIGNSDFYGNAQKCKDYFEDRYRSEMKEFSFDPNKSISMDEFEEIRYIHHRPTDAVLINYLNQYTGCISILSTEQVCENLYDSKHNHRAFATLQLKIIGNLNRELLKIPFFSHCSDCVFDEKKYALVTQLAFYEKMGTKLRSLGLKDSFIYKSLRVLMYKFLNSDWKIQRTVERSDETKRILPVLIAFIDKEQQDLGKFVNTSNTPKDDSMVHLMYYALTLRGINTIRKHNKISNN